MYLGLKEDCKRQQHFQELGDNSRDAAIRATIGVKTIKDPLKRKKNIFALGVCFVYVLFGGIILSIGICIIEKILLTDVFWLGILFATFGIAVLLTPYFIYRKIFMIYRPKKTLTKEGKDLRE